MSECKHVLNRILDDPDTILEPSLQEHLARCRKCAALVRGLASCSRGDHGEGNEEMTPEEQAGILRRLQAHRRSREHPAAAFRLAPIMAAAATLTILVVFMVLILHKPHTQKPEPIGKQTSKRSMTIHVRADSGREFYAHVSYDPDLTDQKEKDHEKPLP